MTWTIRGKEYDLDKFVNEHPGGDHTILMGKGRDCTELFESTHRFSNRAKIDAILSKYYVRDSDTKNLLFDWQNNSFHNELTQKAFQYFGEQKSRKADAWWWIKVTLMFMVWGWLLYNGLVQRAYGYIFLSGITWIMIGFCVMHDASHSAVSSSSRINWLMSFLWNSTSLWNPVAWNIHHVFGHHSHTGLTKKDPDLSYNIILKRPDQHIRSFNSIYRFQQYYVWPILTFLPNQFVSLIFQYHFHKTIFGIKWYDLAKFAKYKIRFANILSLLLYIIVPWYFQQSISFVILANLVYFTALGTTFFTIVIPNHDSITVYENLERFKLDHPHLLRDWSIQQIVSTANFSNGQGLADRVVHQLFGGMNYQIEHHLFPTVSHIHYPALSVIVKEMCTKNNIPYVSKNNIFNCIYDYYQLMKYMSDK